MENIVKTVILLKDLEYYQQMRAAELKYYQEHAPRLVSQPPASTYVQPAILARPEFLVEFDVTAVVKRASAASGNVDESGGVEYPRQSRDVWCGHPSAT